MRRQRLNQFSHQLSKYITGLTLLTFVTLVFAGIFDCTNPIMQSQMNMEGPHQTMADCIPGKNCGMDINEHVNIWKATFTTTLTSNFLIFFFTLLIVSFAVGVSSMLFLRDPLALIQRYRYYERDHRESKLYNYFVHIFSSGILQPKLFA